MNLLVITTSKQSKRSVKDKLEVRMGFEPTLGINLNNQFNLGG